jgi:hypothetical protein
MSLALLNDILLRVLSDPNYTAKGSEITWEEEDTNFKILADAIKELSEVEIEGVEAYNPAEENELGDIRTYGGNTWEYINAIPSTGVTPGTDPSTWKIASQGLYSHLRNSDTKLAEDTVNEVTAAEIRSFIDGFGTASYTVSTTNGIATVIHSIPTESNKLYLVSLAVLGIRTGGSSGSVGDHAVYQYELYYKNIAGTVSIISFAGNVQSESQGAFDITFNTNGTNVEIKVTGASNNNMNWICNVRSLVEI